MSGEDKIKDLGIDKVLGVDVFSKESGKVVLHLDGDDCIVHTNPEHSVKYEPAMTVGELVAILQEYPQDMPVALMYEIFDPIVVSMQTWTHDNYPYDQPDIDFINLE